MRKKINIRNLKKTIFIFSLLVVLSFSVGCSIQSNSKNSELEAASDAMNNITDNIDSETSIALYKDQLDKFNQKYGTEYVLPTDDKEAMEWITSLSPEAFDDFLMALYDGSAHDVEMPRIRNDEVFMGGAVEEFINEELPENTEQEF